MPAPPLSPFRLVRPAAEETPVLVEVPHAGLSVPPAYLANCVAPARSIGRDADLYVDALYADAPLEGASLLVADTSRYVVDLNRSEEDIDDDVVEHAIPRSRLNHGLVWRITSEGERALARPLTRLELEERLDHVYRPYHRALSAELARKREKFGFAVLLAAHSMPSVGRGPQGEGIARADVVPGTRGRTSAAARFIDAVETLAVGLGLSVRHDDPYAGGFSTQFYGRPADGVHAVQIELARRLYLDEATLRPRTSEFDRIRAFCRAVVRALGGLR